MSNAEITMAIPADSRFVALSRLAAAGLAAELDFSIDEVEDLRVGADELVASLVEWAEDRGDARILLTFRLSENALTLEAEIESSGSIDRADADEPGASAALLDELTDRILTSVVDEHVVGDGRGRILKRRAGA